MGIHWTSECESEQRSQSVSLKFNIALPKWNAGDTSRGDVDVTSISITRARTTIDTMVHPLDHPIGINYIISITLSDFVKYIPSRNDSIQVLLFTVLPWSNHLISHAIAAHLILQSMKQCARSARSCPAIKFCHAIASPAIKTPRHAHLRSVC